MAAQANPKVVGGFVVGAAALLIMAVALFGGGNLFAERQRAGTYFQGSVAGLEIGAPVTYQGVRIGEVRSIRLEMDSKDLSTRMPVEFEFIPGSVQWADRPLHSDEYPRLIEKGLRAKLVPQSLVTGLLAIELGYYPGTSAAPVGGLPPSVPEIPSVQSDLQTFKARLGDLPLDRIAASAVQVLARLDTLLAAPELQDSVIALAGSLRQFEALMTTANGQAGPLMDDLVNTVKGTEAAVTSLQAGLQAAIGDFHDLLLTIDKQVQPVGSQLQDAAAAAEKTLQQAASTLRTIDATLGPRSSLRGNLEQVAANLSATSKSLRSFSDQLDRQPNILIMGR
jgi:paraquat-inducible protein B